MNRTRVHPRNIRRSVLASAVACCFAPALAWANPTGPAVAHGQASFNTQGKLLTVTNSPGTIINWKGFSIGAGETTRFVQQNSASAVLNRVVGRDPSSIFGALQSNGRVFLINPNGILFGAGAQINTAGLVASTLDIMDADFLMGRMRFGNTPGAGPLSNAGEIRTPLGGQVLLISPEGVENTGIIHSPKGEVILAAGKSVELTDSANAEVRIEISAPDAKALNLGKIVAESGRVGIYGAVVTNRGVVSADTAVVGENGKIVFKATHAANLEAGSITSASGASGGSVEVDAGQGTNLVAGSVKATGNTGSGGEVRLLGERVGLVGEAAVDVSGERGGGAALIGGDLQGANPGVRNAQMTYVGAGASVKADGGASGDGGKVIVWADDTTRSYGAISARGGDNAGNGGFVETSGKVGLDVRRGPDLRAPAGKPGTWLLDPNDLDVVAGSGLDPATNTGAPFFAPLTDSSTIGVDLINAQLDFGSNVTLTTTSRGPTEGTQQGNITIHVPILKSAATNEDVSIGTTTLTMQAHNNIVFMPGASITSTGDPLNVLLQANSDAMGGGGITLGGAIVTRGGSFTAQSADLIAVNAAINTMNAAGTFGSSVQLQASNGGVNIAAPITGGFVSATGQNGAVNVASPITSTSSVSLSGSGGVNVAAGTAITTGGFSGFSAFADDPGATVTIGAGATVTTRSASLTADNMDIQGVVNAGNGSISLNTVDAARAINIGTESGSALSITQLEFDNLQTTGSLTFGNSSSGPITVNGTLNGSPSFMSFFSGSSYTQNAAMTLSSSIQIHAPTITIAAPLTAAGASGITLTADTLSVGNTVNASGGPIEINTRNTSRQITLGVATPTGTALELTDAQQDNLVSPTRVRFSTSGPVHIAGPISPSGSSTLLLNSFNGAITQAAGASIAVPSLGASASTGINLPEHNDVSNLAAQISFGSVGDINFVAAAGKLVNVTSVDGVAGVTVNNFSGTGNITLQADDFNIMQPVRVNLGNVKLLPETAATAVTLGGDVGGTLSLNNTELGFVQATHMTISGDTMNIPGAVAFNAPTTVLEPLTTDRAVKIVGSKTGNALEFLPAEVSNITGATVVLGGANAGPVSVETTTAAPATLSKLVLHSGGTTSSVTVGLSTPLSATNSIGITADGVDLQSGVSTSSGGIEIATHTPTRKIDLGVDPGTSLGLSPTELGFLSAPAGTISFMTSGGNIDVTGAVSFPNAAGVALDAGTTATLLSAGSLASAGALSIRAPVIDIQGMTALSAGGTGNLTLTGNTFTINASGTTIAAGGDINVMPRDFRSIDLGGAGSGSAIGLDNSELGAMSPTGVLRIGDVGGFTGNILLSSAIALPGRTLSLMTASGSITQSAGATLTATNLASKASGAITLNELNAVSAVALHSDFSSVSFVRAPGAPLVVSGVDNLIGIFAGSGQFASPMPVMLRADQIDIDQSIRGSSVTLLPTAASSIDIGTRSGFGFAQADFDRISATSVIVGEAASDDLSVSAPINVTTFNDLTLISGNAANVAFPITVPGNLSISSQSLSTSAALTSSGAAGNVSLISDALALGAAASAGNSITVRPLTGTVRIDLGGNDTAGVLGVDASEVNNLSAPTLVFGPTPRIDVSAPISTTRSVQLIADDFTIPSAGVSLTSPNLAISTVTGGRTIDLGTSGVGTFMGLDVATLAKLAIADTLSFSAPGASTITVSAAGLTIPANDLSLSAGTININESLAVAGDLALRADAPLNIAAGKTASSTGGGDIGVAPRASAMTFGAGGLLNSTTLAQLSTSGFVELGDSNTTALTIAQALNASAFGGLLLTASGNVSQTAGSTITASKLGVQSNSGSVTLTENNAVGTLAGLVGSFGSFSFTNVALLTIGTVDSLIGITGGSGTLTLRTEGLDIVDQLGFANATLAPRLAGTAINLGSDAGFGLTDAEIDKVSASTLNIGSNTTNASGPITVSAPVDRSFGNLNLFTAPGSSIAVNAALGSSSTGAISMNAGAGGSVTVAAPVVSSSNVSVVADTIATSQSITSDFGGVFLNNVGTNGSVSVGGPINARSTISLTGRTIAVNAPLTSQFSSVSLAAPTGASGSSATVNGAITAGGSISITTDSLALAAPLKSGFAVTLQPSSNGTAVSLGAESAGAFSIDTTELALIDASQLTVGSNNAGDLMVNAPIGPFAYSSLVLRSGGDVSQAPGATITVRNVDPDDPSNVSGSLSVIAGGTINLPEANDIAVSISGSASGTDNNFVFNNITPLRLQNVSGIFASGKVLVRTAVPPPFSPPSDDSGSSPGVGVLDPSNAVLVGLEKAANPGEDLKKSAEEHKDEAEKRDREEQRKRGTQSCR